MKNTKPIGKISVAFKEIDPDLAKRYLARNLANRNLRESTIESYAVDMRSGNWIPTHQGIVRSAKDVQLTPMAEELIRNAGISKRVAKMEGRIRRSEIDGAIK
jgi:site-specific recombinase XerD